MADDADIQAAPDAEPAKGGGGGGLDFSLIGGLVLAFGGVLLGLILEGSSPMKYVGLSAGIIVFGGTLGVIYIFLSSSLVAFTGVLLLGLASVVGQIVTAMILDLVWPAPASPGLSQQLIMAALALVSVVVAAAPWRRLRRR